MSTQTSDNKIRKYFIRWVENSFDIYYGKRYPKQVKEIDLFCSDGTTSSILKEDIETIKKKALQKIYHDSNLATPLLFGYPAVTEVKTRKFLIYYTTGLSFIGMPEIKIVYGEEHDPEKIETILTELIFMALAKRRDKFEDKKMVYAKRFDLYYMIRKSEDKDLEEVDIFVL